MGKEGRRKRKKGVFDSTPLPPLPSFRLLREHTATVSDGTDLPVKVGEGRKERRKVPL